MNKEQAITNCLEACETLMQSLGKERRGHGSCLSLAELKEISAILNSVADRLARRERLGDGPD